jgi:hypothetical protein
VLKPKEGKVEKPKLKKEKQMPIASDAPMQKKRGRPKKIAPDQLSTIVTI